MLTRHLDDLKVQILDGSAKGARRKIRSFRQCCALACSTVPRQPQTAGADSEVAASIVIVGAPLGAYGPKVGFKPQRASRIKLRRFQVLR